MCPYTRKVHFLNSEFLVAISLLMNQLIYLTKYSKYG